MKDTAACSTDKDLTSVLEETCQIEGNFETVVKSFEDLQIKKELLKGIYGYGFKRPSPIQCHAILPCIKGRDVIAQAQSGTGKTATFVIATLQRIDTMAKNVITQAMVVAPTRELAQQIYQVFVKMGQYSNVMCHACIGGTSVSDDIGTLNRGVHVVVGTPGRIHHMIEKRYLNCETIKLFVLDEADEMLQRGFKEQIHAIFKYLPEDVQVLLLSATMPDGVLSVTEKFMRDPVQIYVKKEQLTLQGIRQFYVYLENRNSKVDVVLDILSSACIAQILVFVNSQKDAVHLADVLSKQDCPVSLLHAALAQTERDDILTKYRQGNSRCLIATNLICRGIDIQGVSVVVNFDLPRDYESYLHRIGRSGRYGRKGMAINLVVEEEMKIMKEIEAYYHTEILEMPENLEPYL